jgi:hypothetical protein
VISVNFNIFQDLIETLKSEVSGDFSEILLALFEPPALYDALWTLTFDLITPK